MSTIIDMQEAKADLSRLLVCVSTGEEMEIVKAGRPVARLVAIDEEPAQRLPGRAKDQVVVAPDYDAPLPEDLMRAFEA
jgi:prevent-host-death family protein